MCHVVATLCCARPDWVPACAGATVWCHVSGRFGCKLQPLGRALILLAILLLSIRADAHAITRGATEPDGDGLQLARAGLLTSRRAAGPIPLVGPFSLDRDSIRIVFWGEAERAAERTLEAAHAPLRLPGLPFEARLPPSTIVLAPNAAIMDSITRGRVPAWAAGVAIPSQRLIILPTYQRSGPLADAVVTLRHELAHLALNQHFEGGVPRWFDEGYATWVSGGWDETSGWQIRLALLRGNAPTLDSLTLDWPRGEARARLAYLLSASAVRYLATERGEAAFEAFIAEWKAEGSMEAAMRSIYHLNLDQFEQEWRMMVRRRYGWLLALSQLSIFWLVLTVLVLLLGTLRRRRNRERLEALRREEYMLPPGPPVLDSPGEEGESRGPEEEWPS